MSPSLYITCSFALTYGVPMALAWRELRSLGPSRRGRPDGDVILPVVVPPPPSGEKKLPDCLIPKPMPVTSRPRVRELA
jgi:hypothetical protein